MKTTIRTVLVLACLPLMTGCAALISKQLRGALPEGKIGEGTVAVSVVGAGGGSLHVVGASKEGNTIKAAEYHSKINTGGGSITVDIRDVEVR